MPSGCGLLLVATALSAQAPPAEIEARVMDAVRAALNPALPYPASDQDGELPADGSSTAAWMVRPVKAGDRTLEVIANPLNTANQQRAARAMAQIAVAVDAAQRRSQASYERAVAEARRTGRSQDVETVTLDDEGVAGARIDAEAHVSIEVAFNQPAYTFAIDSSIEPLPPTARIAGAIGAIAVPANVYRSSKDDAATERYCEAQTLVVFGGVSAAQVHRRSNIRFEIVATSTAASSAATAVHGLVIRMRGNGQLIDQIVRLADWSRVHQLVRVD